MARSRITDDLLLQVLSDRGLASAAALRQLLERQRADFAQHQELVAGTAFLVDLNKRELVIKAFPGEQDNKRIPLGPGAGAGAFNINDWERWGSHLLVASPTEGSRLAEYDWQTAALYGLVLSDGKTYHYNEGRLNTDYLALTDQAVFGGVYKGKPQSAPFDLYLSHGRKWLCISDRGAGSVIVLNMASQEIVGSVNVREAGRTQSLNVAIDEAKEQVYITDNTTASMQVLDIKSLELRRERVGVGILGTLVMAPGGKHVYVVSVKPNEGLHYVNTDSWEAEKSIKLKGQLFKAVSSDPCDLLSVSPDGETLLIMTYLNDPNPFTPVVTVIEARQGKTLRR
ncbi:MAG TPA: hypothetical protein V6D23_12965, partial [Candidatus Obscuribacterales bacterium]